MIISALIKEFLKLLMIISNQRGLYPVKNNNKLFSSCSKKEITWVVFTIFLTKFVILDFRKRRKIIQD